ncbi:chemotaxis protein CheY [Pseudomonas chlororaphis subsp. piscium]
MTQKNIRILIVDEQHLLRLHIEKVLNQLGYFRIAPMSSFDEVIAATRYAVEPFDLVIANTAACSSEVNVEHFCRENPFILHALLYNNQGVELHAISNEQVSHQQMIGTGVPDSLSIKCFIETMSPPPPSFTLKPSRKKGSYRITAENRTYSNNEAIRLAHLCAKHIV